MRVGEEGVAWPGGSRFAFTIFDDTDGSTLENAPLVYDLLTDLGFRITKSVWPVARRGPARTGGSTCAEPEYLAWVQRLQAAGHEIGYHNASDHPSTRDETIAALDRFKEMFGHDPRAGADHSGNLEALYWGGHRLSGWHASAYRWIGPKLWHVDHQFQGSVPDSPYFWGDVCRERIDYWRNFTFRSTNLLVPCPYLPYRDPARPYVNKWFAATDGPTIESFLEAVSPANLDRLEAEGGASIVYTHFGTDFVVDGKVDPRFRAAMEALAARPGWFVPTSEVLDHLHSEHGTHTITDAERTRLERRWMSDRVTERVRSKLRRS